jgi:hypothetical protein
LAPWAASNHARTGAALLGARIIQSPPTVATTGNSHPGVVVDRTRKYQTTRADIAITVVVTDHIDDWVSDSNRGGYRRARLYGQRKR